MSPKIGILGGLFDPPHIGHLIIAQSVAEEFSLKKIIFIPSYNPPHKSRYSRYDVRYKLTEMAIKDNKRFSISDIERRISGKTYTLEVIKRLKQEIKGELYLIIGSDQWQEFNNWQSPGQLIQECKIIIVPRPNYQIDKPYDTAKKVLISHAPLLDISSTQIRRLIKKNLNAQYLLPQVVYKYIKNKRLYK